MRVITVAFMFGLARSVATLILVLGLVGLAAKAGATGFFVAPPGLTPPKQNDQAVILLHSDGQEDLIFTISFEDAPSDFGWIAAFPARPDVSVTDRDAFTELSKLTSERRLGRAPRNWSECGGARSYRVNTGGDPVTDIEVIPPEDPAALPRWLTENGFSLPPLGGGLCARYLKMGWYLVAARVDADPDALFAERGYNAGTLTRLRIRFPADEPVYPAGFFLPEARFSPPRLYLLTEAQMVVEGANAVGHGFKIFGPTQLPPPVDPAGDYPRLSEGRARLSELRFVPDTTRAPLLRFEPYEPESAFAIAERSKLHPFTGPQPRILRAVAASYLGWERDPRGIPLLTRFLTEEKIAGVDVISSLWALGQIGDPAAVPTLLTWAKGVDFPARYEALYALGELRAPEVYPILIEKLAQRPKPRTGKGITSHTVFEGPNPATKERELALRLLVETGDSTWVPALRELAKQSCGFERWQRLPCSSPHWMGGETTVAALAGLGDERAREIIVEALVNGSGAATADAMLEQTYQVGATGFPRGFWSGGVILSGHTSNAWGTFSQVSRLFKELPSVREKLFREAARDPRVPEAGEIILLAEVGTPEPAELDRLREIYARALGAKALRAPVDVVQWALEDWTETATYNLNACAVAYAYSRLNAVDELLDMWNGCPRFEAVLRAEIAFAMARTRSPRVREPVVDYIAREWNRGAATNSFLRRLDRVAEYEYPNYDLAFQTIDLQYRVKELDEFVVKGPVEFQDLERLMLDSSLHPYVRLYWITNQRFDRRDRRLTELRLRALERVEFEHRYLDHLEALAEETRRRLSGS